MFIGAVELPNVKSIEKTRESSTDDIYASGVKGVIAVTQSEKIDKISIAANIVSGGIFRSPGQQLENLLSLTNKKVSDCLVKKSATENLPDLIGYLEVSSVKPKYSSSRIGATEVSIDGLLYTDADLITPDAPDTLTNDWSLVLGSNDVDCYTALPVGAKYYGGDVGSSTVLQRTTKDGVVKLIRTNTSDVRFKPTKEYNAGECKMFDTVTVGETTEANWDPVHNTIHEFLGDIVLENGLVRLVIQNQLMKLYGYYSDDGTNPATWHDHGNVEFKPVTDPGEVTSTYFTKLSQDEITLVTRRDYDDSGDLNVATFSIGIKRGAFVFDFNIIDKTANLDLVVTYPAATKYIAVANATAKDAATETSDFVSDLTVDNFTVGWNTTVRAYTVTAHQNIHNTTAVDAGTTWSSMKIASHSADSKSSVGVIYSTIAMTSTPILTNATKSGVKDVAHQSLVKYDVNRVLVPK